MRSPSLPDLSPSPTMRALALLLLPVVALAQPTPTPSSVAVTANKTTGAITGPVAAATLASANSLVTLTGNQTLTNKTLTAPVIGNATGTSIALTRDSNGPVGTFTAGSRSAYHEFFRTGHTARVAVGMLGSPEANVAYNMNYADGVHRLYNVSDGAAWLAIHSGAWALQWAPATGTIGDVWDAAGNPYAWYQDIATGKAVLNTNSAAIVAGGFSAMFTVPRNGGAASISGVSDLVLEGHKTTGTAGVVYINPYNNGDVWIATGGGQVVFPAGSAASPAIRGATGTADTGIAFPSADNIVLSTAGLARISINEDGITTIQRSAVNGAGLVAPLIVRTDTATAGDAVAVVLTALDSGAAAQTYGRIAATLNNATSSSEASALTLSGMHAGNITTFATFDGTAASIVGNLTVSGTQNVLGVPASASALSTNSTMTFELTSNTELKVKVRGTDGTTRSVSLTLAP